VALFRALVGCHRYVSFVGTISGVCVCVLAGSVSGSSVAVCYFFANLAFWASFLAWAG
jgi:hypothetical protein